MYSIPHVQRNIMDLKDKRARSGKSTELGAAVIDIKGAFRTLFVRTDEVHLQMVRHGTKPVVDFAMSMGARGSPLAFCSVVPTSGTSGCLPSDG